MKRGHQISPCRLTGYRYIHSQILSLQQKPRHLRLSHELSTMQQLFLVSLNRYRVSHNSIVEPFGLYFANICSRAKTLRLSHQQTGSFVEGASLRTRRHTKDLNEQMHTYGEGSGVSCLQIQRCVPAQGGHKKSSPEPPLSLQVSSS